MGASLRDEEVRISQLSLITIFCVGMAGEFWDDLFVLSGSHEIPICGICIFLDLNCLFRIKSGLIPAISMARYSSSTRNNNNAWCDTLKWLSKGTG